MDRYRQEYCTVHEIFLTMDEVKAAIFNYIKDTYTDVPENAGLNYLAREHNYMSIRWQDNRQ